MSVAAEEGLRPEDPDAAGAGAAQGSGAAAAGSRSPVLSPLRSVTLYTCRSCGNVDRGRAVGSCVACRGTSPDGGLCKRCFSKHVRSEMPAGHVAVAASTAAPSHTSGGVRSESFDGPWVLDVAVGGGRSFFGNDTKGSPTARSSSPAVAVVSPLRTASRASFGGTWGGAGGSTFEPVMPAPPFSGSGGGAVGLSAPLTLPDMVCGVPQTPCVSTAGILWVPRGTTVRAFNASGTPLPGIVTAVSLGGKSRVLG